MSTLYVDTIQPQSASAVTVVPSTILGSTVASTHVIWGAVDQTMGGLSPAGMLTNQFSISNTFGNADEADTHQFTGSVHVTGGVSITPLSGALAGPGSYLGLNSSNQLILTSSAGGGGGLPAGLDTQIQFNNAGAFGGDANFTLSALAESTLHLTGSQINSGSLFSVNSDSILIEGSPWLGALDINTERVNAQVSTLWLSDGYGTVNVSGGGTSVAGWNTVYANINFEVHYTGSKNPTNLLSNTGGGEVVYYGTGSTTQSWLYYLNTDGGWELANANATGSLGSAGAGNAGLLGIALGSTAGTGGMLVRGYYHLTSSAAAMASVPFNGSWATGSAIYVYSGSTPGSVTATAPAAADSYVRIVGHCTPTPNVIYFNPDSSWIENGP